MTSGLHPRDSIYYLARLAQAIQMNVDVIIDDFPSSNPDFSRAKSQTSLGRAVNHFATLLSRGKVTHSVHEEDRVVAVTATLLDSSGYNVWITSSPATDNESSSSQSSPSESHLILSRNSAPGDIVGGEFQQVLQPSDDIIAVEEVLSMDWDDLKSLSFNDYAIKALQVLRGTALKRKQAEDSDIKSRATRNAEVFFATACKGKIKTRIGSIRRVFGDFDKLKMWTPLESEILPEKTIPIHYTIAGMLEHHIMINNNTVTVNKATIGRIFQTIVQCLIFMQRGLTTSTQDSMLAFTEVSNGLFDLITQLPVTVWQMLSLGVHLKNSKTAETERTIQDKEDEEDEKDVIANSDPWASEGEAPPPACVNFYRMVEAVCAWTTGVDYLLHSHLSDMNVAIVDFPRLPIKELTVMDLVGHWTEKGVWSSDLADAARSEIAKVVEQADLGKGAVHCEAGLAASLLLSLNPEETSGMEPEILRRAFQSMRSKLKPGQKQKLQLAIGVAKKCCPICRMLIEILQASPTSKMDIEFAGGHSRFHLWVAPHWLPNEVLKTLEMDLLTKISEMMEKHFHLPTSRSSSPSGTSDSEKSVRGAVPRVQKMIKDFQLS
ncbi:hypothetical protein C8R47DRAFT_1128928 [Mycena vitilis]|nr:hypothetical protein C8R47DRAFT_1128928 [Mycena vitilis]